MIGQQTLLSVGKKRTSRKAAPVETGTSNPNNVDYGWLPQQTLATLSKYSYELTGFHNSSGKYTIIFQC